MPTILEREMYSEVEAARLLQVPQSTLHYWLEGGVRRNRTYTPIIRQEPKGKRIVTWGEFVEAGWLRAYRSQNVPMAELRLFIDLLRQEFGVPYPLAHGQPLVAGRELVYKAQTDTELEGEYWLVAPGPDRQLVLTGPGLEFYKSVEWSPGGEAATGFKPDSDPDSPVRLKPDTRFGLPNIRGIETAQIWEHVESGEDADSVANAFGLNVADVRWALAYENNRRARAA
jgi:uncharacterized protein (DUF433 family)